MMRYQLIPHTADIEIKAFGKGKKELFANALFGMSRIQQPKIEPGSEARREIKASSSDLASLLVDFLSEALYLSIVSRENYPEVKITKFSDTEIEAELLGQKVKRFGQDIKAVTYYDLKIGRNKQGLFEVNVVFDV